MKSRNGHSQLMDRVSKVVSDVPGKFILVKYYNKNERVDYYLPHVLDVLSNELEFLKRNEKKKTSNGKVTHLGKYKVECAVKFAELIKAVNESHKDGTVLFVYRESGILPKNVYVEPEDLDVFKFVPSGNTAKRYKIKYTKSRTGVVLEYDHDVPYYKLQSVTTGEFLDVPEITIDDIVSMENVILKNVFNFIKYDYFFAEEDVEKVQEIIKTFKLRVCKKCGTSFYVDPRQFNFIKTHSMNLPVLCPTCAKKNRDQISKTVDVDDLIPDAEDIVVTEEEEVVEDAVKESAPVEEPVAEEAVESAPVEEEVVDTEPTPAEEEAVETEPAPAEPVEEPVDTEPALSEGESSNESVE